MVAALCAWHEHHDRAAGEINRRLKAGERLVVAAPALVEAYAVLTRLPSPHRLAADDALALLEANFIKGARVVALDEKSYLALLREAPRVGIQGGQTYDSVIAACGLKGKVTTLLTFNADDFRFVAEKGIKVIVP
jgi:predicted nucleic acid-binding protein